MTGNKELAVMIRRAVLAGAPNITGTLLETSRRGQK
jgi:hypothetical protein